MWNIFVANGYWTFFLDATVQLGSLEDLQCVRRGG